MKQRREINAAARLKTDQARLNKTYSKFDRCSAFEPLFPWLAGGKCIGFSGCHIAVDCHILLAHDLGTARNVNETRERKLQQQQGSIPVLGWKPQHQWIPRSWHGANRAEPRKGRTAVPQGNTSWSPLVCSPTIDGSLQVHRSDVHKTHIFHPVLQGLRLTWGDIGMHGLRTARNVTANTGVARLSAEEGRGVGAWGIQENFTVALHTLHWKDMMEVDVLIKWQTRWERSTENREYQKEYISTENALFGSFGWFGQWLDIRIYGGVWGNQVRVPASQDRHTIPQQLNVKISSKNWALCGNLEWFHSLVRSQIHWAQLMGNKHRQCQTHIKSFNGYDFSFQRPLSTCKQVLSNCKYTVQDQAKLTRTGSDYHSKFTLFKFQKQSNYQRLSSCNATLQYLIDNYQPLLLKGKWGT